MNDQTDPQLLRAYAEHRSEPAFAELVRRHLDFVFSAARRMVCDSHLAEDVAQGVFLALAKNAPQLTDHPVLSGWLHRTTQNIAAQTVRTDVRRRAREQEAAAMNELLATEPDALWEHIAPLLDTALGELNDGDRDALLLRYFERKSAREMAQILGTSEDAAQKRVSRATERLRELFAKRGVTIGAGALVVVISANAIQAAPAGLAAAISAAALAGTTIATTAAVTKAIAMSTLQKTLIATTIAVVAGTGIYEAHQASALRTQVQTLQQQQAPLAGQIRQLQRERDDAKSRLAILDAEALTAKTNFSELLKLRGEVGQLQRQLESEKLQARQKPTTPREMKTNAPGTYIPYDNLANAGYATPEAALETLTWAMAKGTYEQVTEGLSPEVRTEELKEPKNREQFEANQNKFGHLLKGLQILAEKTVSDDKVELKVKMDYDPAINQSTQNLPDFYIQPMAKVGDQWKFGGSTREYREDWETNGQIQSFVP